MLAIASWNGRVMPNPSGAFDTALERMQLAIGYALSAAAVPSNPSVLTLVGRYQPSISLTGRFET